MFEEEINEKIYQIVIQFVLGEDLCRKIAMLSDEEWEIIKDETVDYICARLNGRAGRERILSRIADRCLQRVGE